MLTTLSFKKNLETTFKKLQQHLRERLRQHSLTPIITALLFTPFISFNASAQEIFNVTIEEGMATIMSSFCPPDSCQMSEGMLSGDLTVSIDGDEITFSNAEITTSPNINFILPETPSVSEGGTVNTITFAFDGEVLNVEGSSDQRAFDGPLIEYFFEASVTDTNADSFVQEGYYYARRDQRKCAAPFCGGVFVQRANRRSMVCPDGRRARSCYIAEVDFSAIGQDPFSSVAAFDGGLLIRGDIEDLLYKHFGNVGLLVIDQAYQSYGDSFPPRGRYAGIVNKGVLCITSPCFSYEKLPLNSQRTRALSGIDFSRLNVDNALREQLEQQLANGETLITFGRNKRVRGFSGIGVELVVQRVFLPLTFSVEPEECLTGACLPGGGGLPIELGECLTGGCQERPFLLQP